MHLEESGWVVRSSAHLNLRNKKVDDLIDILFSLILILICFLPARAPSQSQQPHRPLPPLLASPSRRAGN